MSFRSLNLQKNYRRFKSLTPWLMLSVCAVAGSHEVHIVKKGETLSAILLNKKLKPIYGDNGSINSTLSLNPSLQKRKGNKILPGQKILIPTEEPIMSSVEEVSIKVEETKNFTPVVVETRTTGPEWPVSSVRAGLGLEYLRFDTTDNQTKKSAQLLSEASPIASLRWTIHWSEKSHFYFDGSYQRYSIKKADSEIDFVNRSGGLVSFGAGAGRKFGEDLWVNLNLHFGQDLFFFSPSATSLKTERLMIASPSLSAKYPLLKKSRFSLGLEGEYGMLLQNKSDEIKAKNGSFFEAAVYVDELFRNSRFGGLKAKLGYQARNQDTDVATQDSKRVFVDFAMEWDL